MNIKPGYTLSITSWENDGDCYKTQVHHGLTKPDVWFLLALAVLCRSMHDPSWPGGFGGGSWHYRPGKDRFFDDLNDAVDAVVVAHADRGVSKELLADWTVNRASEHHVGHYQDLIQTLVGHPEEEMYRCDGYVRHFDSFTVHHYPEEVVDVSAQFKVGAP